MVIGDYTVDQVIEKAQTLIEAMPYIKKFQGKTVVVKYGGSAMLDENLKYNVIKDVAMLKLVGMKPVIVHGGGKEISKWVEKVGKEAEFINGLRVTDAETMEIAEMVLGKVNKSLVSLMQKIGLKAVGISGKDGGMFTVKKKFPGGKDIGYVGEITNVDTSILTSLIEDDFIPVIAPIGVDENYEDYNINADDAACAVATALIGGDYVVPTGGGGGGNESDLRWDGRRPDEPDFAFQRRCFSHAVKYIMAKYSVKQNKGRSR